MMDGQKPADTAAPGALPADAPVTQIAARVKAHRTALGWSMRELANRAGVSQPFVSKLEGGLLLPSIPTLYALAAAFDTSPSNLLPPVGTAASEAELHIPITEAPGASPVRIVAGGPGMSTQVYQFTLEPGDGDNGSFEHGGEEVIHVLEGAVLFEQDEKPTVRVDAGTTLTIDPRTPHRWRNATDGPARFLLICTTTPH